MTKLFNMIYGNRFFEDEPGGGNPPAGGDPKGGEGNPDLKKMQDRISYLDGELKKVIGDRDSLKGKLREIDEAESLKKGEYEKVINESKNKLSELEKELGTYKSKAESWDKYLTTKQESLKEKIGDKWKDSYANLPLEDLEDLAETFKPSPAIPTDDGKGISKTKIELDANQKKERDLMFASVTDEETRTKYYIEARGLDKPKK